MKVVLTFLFLAGTSAGAAISPNCGQAEQRNYVQAIDRFFVGETTRTDVAIAQLAYIKEAKNCGLMEMIQFCYESQLSANTALEGIQEELKVGMRTQQDLVAAQAEVTGLNRLCTKN